MKVSIKNASLTGDFEFEFENTAVELKKQDQKAVIEVLSEIAPIGELFASYLFKKAEPVVEPKPTAKRRR